jgi:hypothetical protein
MDILSSLLSLIGSLVIVKPAFNQLDSFGKFTEYARGVKNASNSIDEVQIKLLNDMESFALSPSINDIKLLKIGAALLVFSFVIDFLAAVSKLF